MVAAAALPNTVVVDYWPRGDARRLMTCRDPEVLIEGPAGCVAGETRLYNPITGKHVAIRDLVERGEAPTVLTLSGPVQANVPFRKGIAPLFRVTLASGRSFLGTDNHRVLTPAGWTFVARVGVGDQLLVASLALPASSASEHPSAFPRDELHSPQTRQGSMDRYVPYHRRCDGQSHLSSGSDRASLPSRADARGHSRDGHSLDGQDASGAHSRLDLRSDRRAKMGCSPGRFDPMAYTKYRAVQETLSGGGDSHQLGGKSQRATRPPSRGESPSHGSAKTHSALALWSVQPLAASGSAEPAHPTRQPIEPSPKQFLFPHRLAGLRSSALRSDACSPSYDPSKYNYTVQWDTVSSIEYERTDEYFDLYVPGEEHYLAEGIWHHNTGKSFGCLQKLHICAMKYPGMRGLMVRKTFEALKGSAMVTFRERVLHPLDGVEFFGGSKERDAGYYYPNGSFIGVGGMDKPTKIMSKEYDLVYAIEATELTAADWESITSRLRYGVLPYQQLIADCNPDAPTHWLNQRCTAGKTTRLLSRHEDNPALWDAKRGTWTAFGQAYIAKLDALSGVRYERLRLGKWVAAEGVIYEGWDPRLHLIDPFAIPEHWDRLWVVDFGLVHPFVCQWYAIDGDGRLYRYREIYLTGRLVEDHAREMRRLSAGEPEPIAIVTDHDAEDRATLERYLGMSTIAANKAVSPGIQAVQARLRPQADGRPRLFLVRDARVERDQTLADKHLPTCTEEEFDGYVWDTKRELPVKENDHGMDTTRYAVMHLDDGGAGFEAVPDELADALSYFGV